MPISSLYIYDRLQKYPFLKSLKDYNLQNIFLYVFKETEEIDIVAKNITNYFNHYKKGQVILLVDLKFTIKDKVKFKKIQALAKAFSKRQKKVNIAIISDILEDKNNYVNKVLLDILDGKNIISKTPDQNFFFISKFDVAKGLIKIYKSHFRGRSYYLSLNKITSENLLQKIRQYRDFHYAVVPTPYYVQEYIDLDYKNSKTINFYPDITLGEHIKKISSTKNNPQQKQTTSTQTSNLAKSKPKSKFFIFKKPKLVSLIVPLIIGILFFILLVFFNHFLNKKLFANALRDNDLLKTRFYIYKLKNQPFNFVTKNYANFYNSVFYYTFLDQILKENKNNLNTNLYVDKLVKYYNQVDATKLSFKTEQSWFKKNEWLKDLSGKKANFLNLSTSTEFFKTPKTTAIMVLNKNIPKLNGGEVDYVVFIDTDKNKFVSSQIVKADLINQELNKSYIEFLEPADIFLRDKKQLKVLDFKNLNLVLNQEKRQDLYKKYLKQYYKKDIDLTIQANSDTISNVIDYTKNFTFNNVKVTPSYIQTQYNNFNSQQKEDFITQLFKRLELDFFVDDKTKKLLFFSSLIDVSNFSFTNKKMNVFFNNLGLNNNIFQSNSKNAIFIGETSFNKGKTIIQRNLILDKNVTTNNLNINYQLKNTSANSYESFAMIGVEKTMTIKDILIEGKSIKENVSIDIINNFKIIRIPVFINQGSVKKISVVGTFAKKQEKVLKVYTALGLQDIKTRVNITQKSKTLSKEKNVSNFEEFIF